MFAKFKHLSQQHSTTTKSSIAVSIASSTTVASQRSHILRPRQTKNSQPSYHRNQQYSIVGLTNAAGTLVERYSYTAYGTLGIYDASGTVRTTSTYANRYTYTGREYDPDLNPYHFRARWYDPATDSFISRDRLGYVDGMSLYRSYFCGSKVDPLGLAGCDLRGLLINEMTKLIAEQIAWLTGKKVAMAAARTGVLCLIDGPLPIGDVVAGLWLLYDIGNTTYQLSQMYAMYNQISDWISNSEISQLFGDDLTDCLERKGKCCQIAKNIVAEIVAAARQALRSFSSKSKKYKILGDVLSKEVIPGLEDIAKCCAAMGEKRPRTRASDSARECIFDSNRDRHGGANKCEACKVEVTPGKRCESGTPRLPTEATIDHVGGDRTIPLTPETGQILCLDCNIAKGTKDIDYR